MFEKFESTYNYSITSSMGTYSDNYMARKMNKMKQLLTLTQDRMTQMSQELIEAMDSPEFSWLEMQSIMPRDHGIVIHYTPRWPLVVHFSCATFLFLFSAIYHLFNSHSKKMMSFFIRFDYAGICLMIAGSSTPFIYY